MAAPNPGAPVLFLLTNVYPLATGEEFIENEIEYLSASFDRVIVIPTQARPGDTVTRRVPDNVEIVRVGGPRPTGWSAYVAAVRGLTCMPRGGVATADLTAPKRLAMDGLFEDRARRAADELLAVLPSLRLVPGSHAVVYSFWLHTTARIGMILTRDLASRGVTVDRFVSRAHRYDLYPEFAANNHIPERRLLLSSLQEVCPVSEHGSAQLRNEWPEFAGKIHTRHLGTADPGALAQCSREPFHILTCSHLVPVKRMNRMPAVLAGLRERGVDATWTHLGDGPGMDALRSAVASAGVGDRVNLHGHVDNSALVTTERELKPSVFVNLSASEGLPVSMMEVASLGIPIVATNVGGVGEIVTSTNGHLLSANPSDSEVVEALARLVTMPEDEYRQTCRESRRIWEDHFDESSVYPKFCREVLGGR